MSASDDLLFARLEAEFATRPEAVDWSAQLEHQARQHAHEWAVTRARQEHAAILSGAHDHALEQIRRRHDRARAAVALLVVAATLTVAILAFVAIRDVTSQPVATLTPEPPHGVVDTFAVADGTITVRGWAVDQNEPTSSVRLAIRAGGQTWDGPSLVTGIRRDDVASTESVGPRQGFDLTIAVPPGFTCADASVVAFDTSPDADPVFATIAEIPGCHR